MRLVRVLPSADVLVNVRTLHLEGSRKSSLLGWAQAGEHFRLWGTISFTPVRNEQY
jgi:hypothetical protein